MHVFFASDFCAIFVHAACLIFWVCWIQRFRQEVGILSALDLETPAETYGTCQNLVLKLVRILNGLIPWQALPRPNPTG
jgi:hypothetical protein